MIAQEPELVIERLRQTIRTGKYGKDYTIIPRDKTNKLREMYLIDDNAEICEKWNTVKQRKAFNVNREYTIVNAFEDIIKAIA